MTLKKKIIISFTALLSIAVITLAGFYIPYRFAKISYNETETAPVESDVLITRSDDGVPLINASSKKDIFYALGYIHAQDRLNIMEYQRALATGTVSYFINNSDSELIDRLSSILGFTMEAESIIQKLDPELKEQLSAYAEAVNHIRRTRHLAKTGKNDWIPSDVIAILLMKEWGDSFLSNNELIFTFNESKRNELAKIIPAPDKFYFYKDEETQYIYTIQRVKTLVENYIGRFNNGFAAFIHSSLNSSDNRSFTAFSYNGNYNIYPGWYPVNITYGGRTISAVTYNGLPFFFAFRKDKLFFTHYAINADSQDFSLFRTRKNNNSYQYNFRGSWRDFKPVRIPDGVDRSLQTLRWVTDKGPILSDLIVSEKTTEQILCINFVNPGPNYIKIISSGPFEENSEKLKNLILSTDASLKGYIISTGQNSQKIFSGYTTAPSSGNNIFNDASLSPKPDFIRINSSKNISGTDYIGSDLTSTRDVSPLKPNSLLTNTLKAKRLSELLPSKRIYTEEYVQEITADTHSPSAEMFLPLFRLIIDPNPLTSAKMTKVYFSEWDYSARARLQAPSIFFTTLNYLIDETFRDELGNETDTLIKNSYLFYDDFYQIFMKNTSNVFDKINTTLPETRETIFDSAFLKSMRYLNRINGPFMESWTWGKLNKNYYRIPNYTSSFYTRFFKLKRIPANGSPDSLYSTHFSPEFTPVYATSLTGYMSDDSFRFRMNYGYSSSVFSDFYYGKIQKVQSGHTGGSGASYTTVIKPY